MSEQLSPKAIIAESIIENFEAISSYVVRQSLRDMLDENKTLRAENQRLREALQLCIERLEGLKEDGITKAEQAALDSAQAALQPERGTK